MKKSDRRNLIISLVFFGKIETTKVRAKAIRGLIDRLVNKIKKGTLATQREVLKILPEEAIGRLSKEILPKLTSSSSGYTRIIKIGRRLGDGAEMVRMEWVTGEEETKTIEGTKEREGTKVPQLPKIRKEVK